MDIDAAVAFLDAHAEPQPTLHCATYVRLALRAGGVVVSPPLANAREYDPILLQYGFAKVSAANYSPIKGDIVVIQPYPTGNAAGHIAMHDGSVWISDFKQRDFWGGPGYRSFKPAHNFFRSA